MLRWGVGCHDMQRLCDSCLGKIRSYGNWPGRHVCPAVVLMLCLSAVAHPQPPTAQKPPQTATLQATWVTPATRSWLMAASARPHVLRDTQDQAWRPPAPTHSGAPLAHATPTVCLLAEKACRNAYCWVHVHTQHKTAPDTAQYSLQVS